MSIPVFTFDEYCRFWSKVKKSEGCWEWIGSIDPSGYGRVTIRRKLYLVHRVSFANVVKQPGNLGVLHDCDNRSCVNPEHLFLGTHTDNMRDCVAKDRHIRGERSSNAKLTDQTVRLILSNLHLTNQKLADLYGVSATLISDIRNRKVWKHTQEQPTSFSRS